MPTPAGRAKGTKKTKNHESKRERTPPCWLLALRLPFCASSCIFVAILLRLRLAIGEKSRFVAPIFTARVRNDLCSGDGEVHAVREKATTFSARGLSPLRLLLFCKLIGHDL